MGAASEVIALRTRFAALAFGGACQLLQFAVKFFDLPAQLVRVLSDLRDHSLIRIIGDDPVNVSIDRESRLSCRLSSMIRYASALSSIRSSTSSHR